MPFFQNSVINKYINTLDKEVVSASYKKFKEYFHNPEIQKNIRDAKEEQFQEGFLRELFVNILGYTINPNPEYNLTTEYKNEKGARKADGAILKDGKAIAVIELKGTDTKDLDKINEQAFNYKNNQSDCIYVITSNFEKIRFFIHNSVEHIEFNLFTLTEHEFELLWLCLNVESILGDIPLKVKEESLSIEENITKQFYVDYSNFKNDLWQNLVKNHPDLDQLMLYKKSQKLLDRFLFIFFTEDSGLLPPNSISRIVKRYYVLKDEDAYKPLYELFRQLFGYITKGRKGKTPQDDIFAYNGGLFVIDEILENFVIDDDLLEKHVMKLTAYDFESDVDVNILGHIFEHSLNEIENVTARLQGEEVEKSKTKRKKEGVYYTPKYITKYIVENTVGKLCQEKKSELGIIDEEYAKGRRHRQHDVIKRLDSALHDYREWLLNITICDPACGSGAFLNTALEYLINEHAFIDELYAQLHGASIIFQDVSNHILEKNLYGVDINEESIEIAKLSLWLRTAQRGRKLTSLNNNLKCGNSLIDDPGVAGDKAFKWEEEFPKVFADGGFDVVIGNPPYVRAEALSSYIEYFSNIYKVYNPSIDLFAYFYEIGTKLIKKQTGILGYISNTFDKTTAGKTLREYLKQNTTIHCYIDFTEVQVFEGATTYPVIIILNQGIKRDNIFSYKKIQRNNQNRGIDLNAPKEVSILQTTLNNSAWSFLSMQMTSIVDKISKYPSIKSKYGKCYYGVKTALNEAFIVQKDWQLSDHVKLIYEGKEIKKWNTPSAKQMLILFESKWTNTEYGSGYSEEVLLDKLMRDFPTLFDHLIHHEEKAKKRYDKGDYWWELRNCAYYDLFNKSKIIFPNLQNSNKFCLDTEGIYINAPAVFLPVDNKALLCILNSKIVWKFLKTICVVRSGGYIEVKPQYFEQIPIPNIKDEEKLNEKADMVINQVLKLQTIQTNFVSLLRNKYHIENLSKNLSNWDLLNFQEFIKELKKAKIQLQLTEEAEWMEYFNEQKQKSQNLKSEIDQIDKEIDQMVYELYGLTEEEIRIVEEG